VIPKLDGLLSPDGYAELAYDIASPARGLALEALARAGVYPGELEAVGWIAAGAARTQRGCHNDRAGRARGAG
jgi:hypothetical protein